MRACNLAGSGIPAEEAGIDISVPTNVCLVCSSVSLCILVIKSLNDIISINQENTSLIYNEIPGLVFYAKFFVLHRQQWHLSPRKRIGDLTVECEKLVIMLEQYITKLLCFHNMLGMSRIGLAVQPSSLSSH